MGLATEMKNLSEELLSSFKQRIKENEELVSDVQKTLDGFHKDHQEMTALLNANAMELRKGLASDEKERLNTYKELMGNIHQMIASIQSEVVEIQTSTFNMINEFTTDRAQMAVELNKFFADGRADRKEDEKIRMEEFDSMMKDINDDIKNINDEVLSIFRNTNDMLANFEKEHQEMTAELRAELGQNLAERVEYTRVLLNGFQKRLSDISKENQKMAQNLQKDLAKGEATRLGNYKGLMKNIHSSIKDIRKEVNEIKKASNGLVGDYANERSQGAAEWNKMQEAVAQMRKTGDVGPSKAATGKTEKKKETVSEIAVEVKKEVIVQDEPVIPSLPIETAAEPPNESVEVQPKAKPINVSMKTLEAKVLEYINSHPTGVKVSEMEEPLGETRMKLGFTAKTLLDEGKVQKMDNIYFPLK
jgi:hypothetical protein